MYYPYFLSYIVIGFAISLLVFFWAMRTGQFKDQQRARFLPLEEETVPAAGGATPMRRFEIWALFALAVAGLAASGAVLVFSLMNA